MHARPDKEADVTVLFITYQQDEEETLMSLRSVLRQKDICVEIVVSDDGSEENHFDAIKALFERYNFTRYKMLAHEENRGIIKNLIGALKEASAKWVKVLSPGDFFYSEKVLSRWYVHVRRVGCDVSFGRHIMYRKIDAGYEMIPSVFRHRKNWAEDVFTSYITYDQSVGGCLAFHKKDCYLHYLELLAERGAILSEDASHIIMACERVKMDLYLENVIYYERSGISAGFNSRLRDEHRIAFQIAMESDKITDRERSILELTWKRRWEGTAWTLSDRLRWYLYVPQWPFVKKQLYREHVALEQRMDTEYIERLKTD
ncbi:hypothetical protein TAMA11512_04270 [Selenomonas sp. TAMA-11512]|uniref:glycosyltransferase family 2 protein n=1 Tax=Selenomonas sp. TAMA-11512 TaxID=3095337 RepID=UPI00308FD6DE|nr:hypothetical protein TAMA11512_04270 [Selenomonas sp. TAMA-11512]